jgi:hypothetical protein
LIEIALGKKCHLDKPVRARMQFLAENPQATWTILVAEMLMCASGCKAYDVPSPTMDITRCYLDSVLAGINSFD